MFLPHRSFSLCSIFLCTVQVTTGRRPISPLPLVFLDRRLHHSAAFLQYYLPDNVAFRVIFFVCFQKTVHENSRRRLVPSIARCARQINAEVVGRATFTGLGIKILKFLRGDGVLFAGFQFIDKELPDFSLRVD